MKRIAFIVVMTLISLTASASSIRYFTYSQATRTVQYLNAQNEIMIYCGYDYEIETYVLVNEIWKEKVNSSYYEIWIYGYDAYTGDEIYMPLDLECVWLYGPAGMYNAAQYLRFHATVRRPTFTWYIPPYYPFTRAVHHHGYVRTYHYDIHRHGWMPPAPPAGGWSHSHKPPLPPYYMRAPQAPRPTPAEQWTPGQGRPQIIVPSGSTGNSGAATPARPTTGANASPTRSTTTSTPAASPTRSTTTTTPTTSPTRSTTTTTPTTSPSRSTGSNTSTTSPSRNSGSNTSTTSPSRNTGSNTSTTSPSRNSGSNTSTTSPSRNSGSNTSTTSPSRSTGSTNTSSPSRSTGSTNTSSPSRSVNTTPSSSPSRSTGTNTTSSPQRSNTSSSNNQSNNRTASPRR